MVENAVEVRPISNVTWGELRGLKPSIQTLLVSTGKDGFLFPDNGGSVPNVLCQEKRKNEHGIPKELPTRALVAHPHPRFHTRR